MILTPPRQLICPRCRKPFAKPTQRRPRLRRTRNDPRDRFRPSLLNMAAGATLLDATGKRMLRSDGKKALDNGTDNSCCCGSGSGCADCGALPFFLCTFTGCDSTNNCDIDGFQFAGSLSGDSFCVHHIGDPTCERSLCVVSDLALVGCGGSYNSASAYVFISITRITGAWVLTLVVGLGSGCVSVNPIQNWLSSVSVTSDCTSSVTYTIPALLSPADGTTMVNGGTITIAPGGC